MSRDHQRIARKVANDYVARHANVPRQKTAGEVIFRKDNSNDANAWAYGIPGGSQRHLPPGFVFDPKHAKPLAKVLKSTLAALGHVLSAQSQFAKIKSAQISPDGFLGGKGYIQKISDIRRSYMNVVEALSSSSDTFYDELMMGPHWSSAQRRKSPAVQKEVGQLLAEAEEIREDPEGWAEESGVE